MLKYVSKCFDWIHTLTGGYSDAEDVSDILYVDTVNDEFIFSKVLCPLEKFSFIVRDYEQFIDFCTNNTSKVIVTDNFRERVLKYRDTISSSSVDISEINQVISVQVFSLSGYFLSDEIDNELDKALQQKHAFGFFEGLTLIVEILTTVLNQKELLFDDSTAAQPYKTFEMMMGEESVTVCLRLVGKKTIQCMIALDHEIEEPWLIGDQVFAKITT